MKTKLLKAFSVLLTISLLIISFSFTSVASDFSKLEISGDSIALDGTTDGTVKVSLVASKNLVCYGIEGTWDLTNQEATKYITLDSITFQVLDFAEDPFGYIDSQTGKVIWNDFDYYPDLIPAGTAFLTATYKVAKDTPAGEYTVRFCSQVFTDDDGYPDETVKYFEAKITVTHVCTIEEQAGQAATCVRDGWKAYYKCSVCGNYYSDAQGKQAISSPEDWKDGAGKLPAKNHVWGEPEYTDNGNGTHDTTYTCGNDATHTDVKTALDHEYIDGECVCGAKEPVTGLKGDVDLDGDVDMADAILLMKHVLKDEIITDEASLANSEVTGNEELGMDDAEKIARFALKDISSLD